MVNKIFKGLIRFLIEVIVMTVLIVGINIFTNGMYLWGLPRINDIQSVNITYPSVTDDVKEISSREDIELALKLTGFLKYDLFGEVNSEEETGEISDRVFNYLVDASKNSFYTLSDEMSEFFEKNHYFKKSDFDIQDFSVEIFRYFINEGVIVIHEDN